MHQGLRRKALLKAAPCLLLLLPLLAGCGEEPAPPLPPLAPPGHATLDPGPRLAQLPTAELKELPRLLSALADMQQEAKDHPGQWRDGNIALGAPPREYLPSEADLLAAELGRRIEEVVAAARPEDLAKVLDRADITASAVAYDAYSLYSVEVMGSGLFTYVQGPEERSIPLR